jgi:hypothetical protein
MTARERESAVLTRCVTAASETWAQAHDAREANVFHVAALVVRTRFPEAAARLMATSARYFADHPSYARIESAEVVRQGWVVSLPRLRDFLSRRLVEAGAR